MFFVESRDWDRLFIGVVMLLGAPNAWFERNQNPGIFPPSSQPYGMTYPEWSGEWAQWGFSIPVDQSPFLDPDGRYCQVGQSPPVFFLGNNGGGETLRYCTIPAGQSIAFAPGGSLRILHLDAETEEELRALVEEDLTDLSNVTADIDGVSLSLEKYLFISEFFSFTLPENSLFGLPAGQYQGINGGYLLIHAPLPVGEHVIHTHDEFPAFSFVADVTYVISVTSHR